MGVEKAAAPLRGIRVLDLGRHLAGPTAAMWLADLGAEVIKIEKPGKGEHGRVAGPPFVKGESIFFVSANRSKKSLALDLKRAEGKEVFRRLTAGSDVVLENFRPGVMDAMGIGYAVLRKIRPQLIYCSISGFGREGPMAASPAVDQVIQAFSGIMSITGFEGGEPVRSGIPLSDLLAGLFAAYGILAALYNREKTGRGQRVDTSLLESMVAMLNFQAVRYLNGCGDPPPAGNHHPIIAPYGVFQARDGHLVIGATDEKSWRKLCQVLEAPELLQEERFKTNAGRFEHRLELADRISDKLQGSDAAEWAVRLNEAGIPSSPIQSVGQALEHPQLAALKMAVPVDHPRAGELSLLRFPVNLSGSPAASPVSPPLLGQHTREILTEAGFSKQEIKALEATGVVEQG